MRRQLTWISLAMVLGAATYATTARATSGSGFTAATIASGRFDELDVKNASHPSNFWSARLKTKGVSDLYVQSNTWAPGGTTGWHTHPGHSLIIVTEGTVTVYAGDDQSCTPQIYSKDMTFVDEGGDHVHVIRNEGAVPAKTVAVQLIPAAAPRRIDAPAPGYCAF